MDKVSKLLLKNMSKKGLGGAAVSSQICFYADKWGKGRFSTISFTQGTLKLAVSNSSLAQELDMEKQKLMDYIEEKIGRKVVKKVRIINTN